MARDVILTPEGLEKLKDELQELQSTRRREVAERGWKVIAATPASSTRRWARS